MALDERYRWKFAAKDAHGRDVEVGVGIEVGTAGRPATVIVSAPRWFQMDDAIADQFAYGVQSAAEIIRQRARRS